MRVVMTMFAEGGGGKSAPVVQRQAHPLPTGSTVKRVRRRTPITFLAVAGAIACASPSDRVVNELEDARSWIATVELVGSRWSDNRVPARYARRTIEESLDALHAASQSLSSDRARREATGSARARIDHARQIAQSLLSSIERNDRRATTGPIAQLGRERKALDSLIEKRTR